MSKEPKPGLRLITRLHLVAIGIGLGTATALANHPSWRTVSGGVVFGLAFALTVGIAQARRAHR